MKEAEIRTDNLFKQTQKWLDSHGQTNEKVFNFNLYFFNFNLYLVNKNGRGIY